MKRNSPSYVPVVEQRFATSVMPMYGKYTDTAQMPTGIIDVLTIGEEATVFHPVQQALRPSAWSVAHAENLSAAMAYLQSNVAAVAVTEAKVTSDQWRVVVSRLRDLPDAPEVVIITSDELPLDDVLRSGAFDVLRCPIGHSDLLWAVAAAWHNWMTRREGHSGGEPCSGA